jgi:hypothetical protein
MIQRESLHNPYRLSVEQFLQLDGRTLDEILAAVVCDIEPAPPFARNRAKWNGTAPARTAVLLFFARRASSEVLFAIPRWLPPAHTCCTA